MATVRESAISSLSTLLGERLSTNASLCRDYGRDEGHLPPAAPDAVAFVASTEELAQVVRICAAQRLPMIARGAGTSLEGQVHAARGGLCIDFSRMQRIVAVNDADMDARVEAGVTRKQLNTHLRDRGLFFSVDPGADASFGGMASTRASGTNTVRYGSIRDNVLTMQVVLADGRIIETGRRVKKSAAGYDLTGLFIGAEGTLGLITEISVRLHGRPEAMSAAVCSFPSLTSAVDTVIATIQSAIPVARIELLDEVQIEAVNRYAKLALTAAPTLFLEFHGSHGAVADQAQAVGRIAADHGGGDFRWATRDEERRRLWRARHDAAYACKALRTGCEMWPTDVCVPISRLSECISLTRADIDRSGLVAPIVGHVGDGNFHVVMVVDVDDASEMRRAVAFNDRLVERALNMGGTCTGEHGIGCGKRAHLLHERGESVAVMQAIKQAVDPLQLLNPGKIFVDA